MSSDTQPDGGEPGDLAEPENDPAASPPPEPDSEVVVYEIAHWPPALLDELAQSLAVAGVEFDWDSDGNAVVAAEDEELTDQVFEAIPDPDDPEAGSGPDAQTVLTELYDTSGALARNPDSAPTMQRFGRAAMDMVRMSVPFGIEPGQWRRLGREFGELADRCDIPGSEVSAKEWGQVHKTLQRFI